MSLMHKQLPSFVAADPGNRDLPPMRTDFTCIGVRRAGSRKRSICGRNTFSYTAAIPISSARMVPSNRAVDADGRLGELLDQPRRHRPPSIRP
jgi:hypothetical protein